MESAGAQPIRLEPVFRERIWGRENLTPLFPDAPRGRRIGEVWFTPEALGAVNDGLLVKFLFTSARLSVQVHPNDDYARRRHGSLGKTEAWYVLDARPPGEIAAGFRETLTRERLRETAHSGEIEQLLDWRKVQAGDIIFVPAGTVHAIGTGLTICEIQENSDITYRLYDYGRGRDLHLDDAIAVSHLGPHEAQARRIALADWREELLACAHFRIERLRPQGTLKFDAGAPYYRMLICTRGTGSIGAGTFSPGSAWFVPAGNAAFSIDGADSEWIFTYTAEEPTTGVTEKKPARARQF
ncbi:MAG: class I mannose-6-phosphate isomerase [Bryobacteraceae bacterium]